MPHSIKEVIVICPAIPPENVKSAVERPFTVFVPDVVPAVALEWDD